MAHGQVADSSPDYYDLPLNINNKGILYEEALFAKLKEVSVVPRGFKPAGSDSLAPDLKFIWLGKVYNLEVKLDKKADYGQSGLRYVNNAWQLDGSSASAHVSMRQMLHDMGITKFVNSREGWGGLGQPRKYLVESHGINTTWADKESDYGTFLDKYISIPNDTVTRYYNSKGIYYIHIGKLGTFYMGSDPANMARATEMAEFDADLKLRIRKKGSSSNPNYRFSLALLLANIPLASRFDISDNASIQQLIMNR